MLYIFLFTIFSVVFAYEKDMTFTVQAGRTDCFYHEVAVDEIIDLEYQVIDASHGELDISFQLADPVGRVIVADYKKPENSHRHTSTLAGDYRFCFDNTFSTFSTKTVSDQAETYMMRVRDISESVSRVRDNMSAAKRLQELHSAHEARDRNIAEGLCARYLHTRVTGSVLVVRCVCGTYRSVWDNMSAAKRLQELHSAHEARDRNIAEGLCARYLHTCVTRSVLVVRCVCGTYRSQ
ncbi:Transmembrane emp24 domain-containing protein 5 [Operophtera brumata]|uniref:Transmembrane emp24 domain-containing protein 5 n=1 Tax=Operophtera brumata TaxID=104452 RepID=A0A0L7KYY2_OPEBR|nr:Transmembrane emp24 domain-containing protein 5 [Operophtera brumata]